MQNAGQFGPGAASTHPPSQFVPSEPSPTGGSTTSSLRQFRKKDVDKSHVEHQPPKQMSESHVARIAPHNHYPPVTNDGYARFSAHQFSGYGPQVKYSDLAEPTQPNPISTSVIQKPKPKDYMEMCNVQQQHLSNHQQYSPDNGQYMHKDPAQGYPTGFKPESHFFPKDQHQYQQLAHHPSPPKFNAMMSQNMRKYNPAPPDNPFLNKLSKLHPSMARSIISDHHLQDTQPTFSPVDQRGMYGQQNHRYYTGSIHQPNPYSPNPNYSMNAPHPYANYPSASCNYPRPSQMAPVAPRYPHMERSMSPGRRGYPDGMHMPHMNYHAAMHQKMPPGHNYSPQYRGPEYAQHYQHRRVPQPQDLFPPSCRTGQYMPNHHQISGQDMQEMAENTVSPSDSLKKFIENWADEEPSAEINPMEANMHLREKLRDDAPAGTVYMINATDVQYFENNGIPIVTSDNGGFQLTSENYQYLVKNGLVDTSGMVRIIEANKEISIDSGGNQERIVNLQIMEAPKSDCMMASSKHAARGGEGGTNMLPKQEDENRRVVVHQNTILNPGTVERTPAPVEQIPFHQTVVDNLSITKELVDKNCSPINLDHLEHNLGFSEPDLLETESENHSKPVSPKSSDLTGDQHLHLSDDLSQNSYDSQYKSPESKSMPLIDFFGAVGRDENVTDDEGPEDNIAESNVEEVVVAKETSELVEKSSFVTPETIKTEPGPSDDVEKASSDNLDRSESDESVSDGSERTESNDIELEASNSPIGNNTEAALAPVERRKRIFSVDDIMHNIGHNSKKAAKDFEAMGSCEAIVGFIEKEVEFSSLEQMKPITRIKEIKMEDREQPTCDYENSRRKSVIIKEEVSSRAGDEGIEPLTSSSDSGLVLSEDLLNHSSAIDSRNALRVDGTSVVLHIAGELMEITVNMVDGRKVINVTPLSDSTTIVDYNDNYEVSANIPTPCSESVEDIENETCTEESLPSMDANNEDLEATNAKEITSSNDTPKETSEAVKVEMNESPEPENKLSEEHNADEPCIAAAVEMEGPVEESPLEAEPEMPEDDESSGSPIREIGTIEEEGAPSNNDDTHDLPAQNDNFENSDNDGALDDTPPSGLGEILEPQNTAAPEPSDLVEEQDEPVQTKDSLKESECPEISEPPKTPEPQPSTSSTSVALDEHPMETIEGTVGSNNDKIEDKCDDEHKTDFTTQVIENRDSNVIEDHEAANEATSEDVSTEIQAQPEINDSHGDQNCIEQATEEGNVEGDVESVPEEICSHVDVTIMDKDLIEEGDRSVESETTDHEEVAICEEPLKSIEEVAAETIINPNTEIPDVVAPNCHEELVHPEEENETEEILDNVIPPETEQEMMPAIEDGNICEDDQDPLGVPVNADVVEDENVTESLDFPLEDEVFIAEPPAHEVIVSDPLEGIGVIEAKDGAPDSPVIPLEPVTTTEEIVKVDDKLDDALPIEVVKSTEEGTIADDVQSADKEQVIKLAKPEVQILSPTSTNIEDHVSLKNNVYLETRRKYSTDNDVSEYATSTVTTKAAKKLYESDLQVQHDIVSSSKKEEAPKHPSKCRKSGIKRSKRLNEKVQVKNEQKEMLRLLVEKRKRREELRHKDFLRQDGIEGNSHTEEPKKKEPSELDDEYVDFKELLRARKLKKLKKLQECKAREAKEPDGLKLKTTKADVKDITKSKKKPGVVSSSHSREKKAVNPDDSGNGCSSTPEKKSETNKEEEEKIKKPKKAKLEIESANTSKAPSSPEMKQPTIKLETEPVPAPPVVVQNLPQSDPKPQKRVAFADEFPSSTSNITAKSVLEPKNHPASATQGAQDPRRGPKPFASQVMVPSVSELIEENGGTGSKKKISLADYVSRKRKASCPETTESQKKIYKSDETSESKSVAIKTKTLNDMKTSFVIHSSDWEDSQSPVPTPVQSKEECLIQDFSGLIKNSSKKPVIDVNELTPLENPKDRKLQEYKDKVDSQLSSLNIKIPQIKPHASPSKSSSLVSRFLNNEKLSQSEMEKIREFISYKRSMQRRSKARSPSESSAGNESAANLGKSPASSRSTYSDSSSDQPYEVRKNSRVETDPKEVRLHLKKVNAKRKLLSDDEDCSSPVSNQSENNTKKTAGAGGYSVFNRLGEDGQPKIILKRNRRCSLAREPIVELVKLNLDDLDKVKEKYNVTVRQLT